MGLDTTHDCWHGAYSAFMRWRLKLAEVAGLGDLYGYQGFGGDKPFPEGDVLTALLYHSDCDGSLPAAICGPLADRLTELVPALRTADAVTGGGGGHIGSYAEKTQVFIDGLRRASEAGEDVEFH